MAKKGAEDPDWEATSAEIISDLQDPFHIMILLWNEWYMAENALYAAQKWNTANNPARMIKREVIDVYRAMRKIRALEKKLGKSPKNSGTSDQDWIILNQLMRDLGIDPDDIKDDDGVGSGNLIGGALEKGGKFDFDQYAQGSFLASSNPYSPTYKQYGDDNTAFAGRGSKAAQIVSRKTPDKPNAQRPDIKILKDPRY